MYNDFGQYVPQTEKKVLHIFGFTFTKSKIAIILLALALIVETIFFIITAVNYSSITTETANTEEGENMDSIFFSEDGTIKAITATCKSKEGTVYQLYASGKYDITNPNGYIADNGTYYFKNDSNILFTNNDNKQLVFTFDYDSIINGEETYNSTYEANEE